MAKTKISPKLISLSFGILVLLFLVGFYVFAWQEPTTSPPGGNVAAPLNVGNADQYKSGRLGIGTSGDSNYNLTVGTSRGVKITNAGTQPSLYVEDQSGDSTPFVIDANGNIGIGTTGTSAPLHLEKDLGVASGSHTLAMFRNIPPGAGSAGMDIMYEADGTSVTNSQLYFPGQLDVQFNVYPAGDVMTLTTDGNVGIGTTGPNGKLQVAGGYVIADKTYGVVADNYVVGGRTHIWGLSPSYPDAGLSYYEGSPDYIQIHPYPLAPGGNNGLVVNGNGNVGIGTTSPQAKLEVAGQIKITAGSPGAGKVLTSDASGLASWQTPAGGLPSGTSGQTLRHDGTNWVANSVLFNNGTNVGIGITSPNDKLEVAGNIRANRLTDRNSTGYYVDPNSTSRQYRINTNILDFSSGADARTAADGVLFRYGSQAAMAFDDWFRMYDSNNGALRIEFNIDDASVRANRYYDRNNTSYYLDPASTSKLNSVQFYGELMPDGATCSNGQILKKSGSNNWDCVNMPSGGVSGSGSTNYLPKWTGSTSLGNSAIYQSGSNIGIGTTSPQNTLDVFGAVRMRNLAGNNNGYVWEPRTDNSYLDLTYRNPTNVYSKIMSINYAGNVGIGTTSPTQKLDVAGYVKGRSGLCIGNDCRSSWPSAIDLQGWSFQNDKLLDDGENVIQTSDEWLRLNQQSQFTNGVYTPGLIRADGGFQVDGKQVIDNNAGWHRAYGNAGFYFQDHGGGWYMSDSTYIKNYGSKRVYLNNYLYAPRMYDYNDTGYYVDPNSTSKLNTVYGTAFYYSSDINLKKDVLPLENSLEKVLNLEGVSFKWKENNEPSIGLIAQDVEKIFPEAVTTDKETGLESIDYGKLVAPLIESIKEQQKEIEGLKAEVEELKGRIK